MAENGAFSVTFTGREPGTAENETALVVAGSLWIMDHLNANMASPSAAMEMQR